MASMTKILGFETPREHVDSSSSNTSLNRVKEVSTLSEMRVADSREHDFDDEDLSGV